MKRNITKHLTPSSASFARYIREVAKPTLYKLHSRAVATQLLNLVHFLEQERYDFSADRAYQTRPICINELAIYFEVTCRSIQRWLAALEKARILKRIFRKNPASAYRNRFSRLSFPDFKCWIQSQKAAANDTQCHPIKKDNLQLSINDKKTEAYSEIAFPSKGGISFYPFWNNIARINLPTTRRPCSTIIAEKFRTNLRKFDIPLNHKSVPKRWANFCRRAHSA